MMKRIFAMVLAVCMTLTLLPVSALAARSSREDQPLAASAKGEEALDRAEAAAAKPAAAEDALADGEITDSNQPGAFIQARDDQAARYFTNLKYALNAATDGDTVVLKMGSKTFAEVMGSDEEYVVRQSDLTIDLGGNTVNDVPNYKLILAGQGITLQRGTLNGADTTDSLATTGKVSYVLVTNGNNTKLNDLTTLGGISVSGGSATLTEVNATGTNYYAVCAQVGADVTIESGTYQKAGLAEGQGYQANSVLWVESGSTMVIHGGTFTAAEGGNIVLKGHRAPTISGGTFNRDMTAENATLAEGFEQKQENGGWTVTEKPKPEVGPAAKNDWGTEYDTLQEAINAAEENSTICHNIYLLRNVTEDVTVDGNRTVQIGLGNSNKENYTLTTAITVKSGSFLRLADYNYGTKVTDTATWAANHGDAPIVTVEAGGEFELSQGGMKGTGTVIQNNGGTVTLAQESWLDGTVTGPVARIASDAKLSETAKNSIGEISGKEWLNTAAPGKNEGNWYISGTAAIEVGDRRYGYQDLQLAIDQAGENETVKLLSNVTASVTVGADKKIILDLNGKKLEGAKPSVKNQDPTLKNLGTLTITGNGTVKANSNSRFDGDTVVNEGKLTVESGKFQTKSGHVSLKNSADKANVIVKNGTFAEDVSAIATPGEGLEFAEDGKSVVKAKVAQITKDGVVTKYETLQDAIAAAEEGDTVTLLKDVELTKAIQLNKSVKIDGGASKHALSSTAPGGRMFEAMNNSACAAIEMTNVTLKIKANGTYGAVPFYNHKTDGVLHFSFADGSIVAAEEENVYLVNLFQGQNVKYTFTGNTVAVPAQGLLVNAADGSVVTSNTIDLKGEAVAANSKRTGVISVNEKNVTEGITVTGNTFKNANRVLGVDHAVGLTNDNLTFKDNAMIDCRWAFELDPTAQSGFDLGENYYCFDGTVGVLRVENAASSGSHFEFGNETGTEYVLTDTNNAVSVSSYYTDEEMTDLVEFAARLIDVETGAVTAYATVAEALAASKPGDTVKVLSLDEAEVEDRFTAIPIPNDKAVQLECGEELAAEFEAAQMDPALYLPAYFSYQAKTANFGGGNSKFALYGGVESGLAGENTIRTKGDGKTYAYTYIYLYENWTLTGNVTLPSRNNSTTSVYAMGEAVTVDLNGWTLEQEASPARTPGASTTAGWDGFPAIIAYNGKTATVKDSSEEKTGKVIGSSQTFDVYPGATLNLESGTFTTRGNWYNVGDYNGFGSIVRMDGGTLNISGGALTIPEDNNAHSVKMAATIMLRGKQAENPTRAYAINIKGGVIKTVPAAKRADASMESLYAQNDGFVAINKPVIQDETYPNGENITYAITGGTFDMDLRGKADSAGNAYLSDSYESPESAEGSFTVAVKEEAAVLNADGTVKQSYPSLAAAVAAAESGETVKLLKDTSGAGVIVDQSITIDFGGHTYTVDKTPLAGSTGTKSQAFQLLAGADKANPNSVTMRNGVIVLPATTENLQMGIQNYTNLTLDGMTLDASANSKIAYVLSNNNGSTTITGGAVLKAAEGKVAFDVYDYSANGYGNVSVSVDNATVVGEIEVSNSETATLTITGGTFTADVNRYCKDHNAANGYCQDQTTGVVAPHNTEGVVEHKDATCIATGVKGGNYCTVCNNGKADAETVLEMVAHNTNGTVAHKDATCTEAGVVGGTYCDRCNDGKAAAEAAIPATGHNTNGIVQHKAPTCTEAGVVGGTYCTNCEEGKEAAEKSIAALGHDLTKWAFDDTNHWHVCSRCDAADEAETPAAHNWVRGTASGGWRTDTCECGATRTVSVSVGGGSSSGGSSTPAPDPVVDPEPQPPEEDLDDPDVPLTDKPFPFVDVKTGDWFYDAVKFVAAANIMVGVDKANTTFAPMQNTTRGTVATLIHRMEETPDAKLADFSDVLSGAWYTEAVNWTDDNGVMIGFPDGTFRPEAVVTREQLTLVFYRYAKFLGYDVSAADDLSAFVDAEEVGDWAEESMAWAVGTGLIQGRGGARLAPQSTTTRGELATMLRRFLEMKAPVEQ